MRAGLDVPGPHPARHRLLGNTAVGDLRAMDHAVADHDRRRVYAVEHRIQVVAVLADRPWQPDHRVDHAAAVGTEIGTRTAGLRLDAHEVAVSRAPEDALVVVAVRPVGDPPLPERPAHRGGALFVALGVEHPEGLAGRRVDRDALRERRIEIEHAADHERCGLHPAGTGRVPTTVEIGRVLDPATRRSSRAEPTIRCRPASCG